MKKDIFIGIALTAVTVVLVWFFFGFVLIEYDVRKWSTTTRGVFVSVLLFSMWLIPGSYFFFFRKLN